MKPELVVMAAGMGSRYGGLKQLEPVGPSGETVMDYSLYDARRSGIERVIFVIRRELEEAFRQQVGNRYARWMDVAYAFQEKEDLPEGFAVLPERVKPWGTGHAVLAARTQVRAPFVVINADDFYGQRAFEVLARWLEQPTSRPGAFAMVAFRLANTLSEHGSVARGVCEVGETGLLKGVEEHTGLEPEGAGAKERLADGGLRHFTGQEPVSMNFWGFRPEFFPLLQARFSVFLQDRAADPKAEFYLPAAVDDLIQAGQATVRVLDTPDRWFGVTYREDKATVEARLRALVAQGAYPGNLWG